VALIVTSGRQGGPDRLARWRMAFAGASAPPSVIGAHFRLFLDTGKRRLDGVTEEVDEELLDLVGVGEEFHIGGREQPHVEANLERHNALEQWLQRHTFEHRRGSCASWR